jgi:hypothetical protein
MALTAENVVLRGHLVNQSARLTALENRLFQVEAAEAAAWRLERSRDESTEILLRRVLEAVEAPPPVQDNMAGLSGWVAVACTLGLRFIAWWRHPLAAATVTYQARRLANSHLRRCVLFFAFCLDPWSCWLTHVALRSLEAARLPNNAFGRTIRWASRLIAGHLSGSSAELDGDGEGDTSTSFIAPLASAATGVATGVFNGVSAGVGYVAGAVGSTVAALYPAEST